MEVFFTSLIARWHLLRLCFGPMHGMICHRHKVSMPLSLRCSTSQRGQINFPSYSSTSIIFPRDLNRHSSTYVEYVTQQFAFFFISIVWLVRDLFLLCSYYFFDENDLSQLFSLNVFWTWPTGTAVSHDTILYHESKHAPLCAGGFLCSPFPVSPPPPPPPLPHFYYYYCSC